jgi:class 3 adenylate cyclase
MLMTLRLHASTQGAEAFVPLSISFAWDDAIHGSDESQLPTDLSWRTIEGQRLTLGYHTRVLWIRIHWNTEAKRLAQHVLDLGNAHADHVRLFHLSGNQMTPLASTGDARPFHARAYPHRSLMFNLESLEPEDTLILRVTSTAAHNYWIRVTPEHAIWHEAGIEDFLYGTSIGIIFIMVCYNLFVFLLQRDKSHLFYTLYATSYIFLVLGYKGYGFQYLWSMAPELQKFATGIGIHTTVMSFVLFARSLFIRDVDRYLRPWLDATFVVAFLSLVFLVSSMDQAYWKQYGIAGMSAFAFGVYILATFHVWKHPDRSLWITLGAILCLHLGGMVTLLSAIGLLPYNWMTNNAMIIGGNIEMTLLTFALADRFHSALRERARTDQALRGAVDDELAEKLKSNPQLLREEASERDLTVLFLDIVNSSSTSQMFPSHELYHKLRMTLNDITRIIRTHGGVVNRSLGDGVLCYFGVSWDGHVQADHPTQALRAAIALQRHFLTECLDTQQRILFPVRIGLHSGVMYLGSIGDQQRVDFTLFGYEVNIAKRLEDAANPFRILLSQASFDKLDRSVISEALHPIRIRIKNQSELLLAYECNPFAKEAARLEEVQIRLWSYFGSQIRGARAPLCIGMNMEIADETFAVLDVSHHGLCVEGPIYFARGVEVELKIAGDGKLESELESSFIFPLYATVRWSEARAGVYRHGLELQHLHPRQLMIWLRLFRPYINVSDVG